ncbi:hypothetical protein SAMN02745244_01322 [Tessaracoccus bendigoensis DSM 12906]|uniref:Uncharacterized protein n=1 Tax=Tessaracoccus bendigoensis DSM 12906 TaxID=1123357 RepID=A0A1M6F057_9ACTN|nr:hypothetical protein [Tessaracoccus bendigoensis]SHI91108.1 hypothetical protein SAMN02745244_01322 [Tessaracoccus bendigoensis DSM 12906]
MAEVRKFDEKGGDELQRLVREQIGDTVLPHPPGASVPVEPLPVEPETETAVTSFASSDSFLYYGEGPDGVR